MYAGHWCIPYLNDKGTITSIRRWKTKIIYQLKGSSRLLYGFEKVAKATRIWLCESEWDALALSDVLDGTDVAVATPGAGQFNPTWSAMFKGKNVILVGDNDKAGREHNEKLFSLLKGKAREIYSVDWSDGLAEKYDVRDYLNEIGELDDLEELLVSRKEKPKKIRKIATPRGGFTFQSMCNFLRSQGLYLNSTIKETLKVISAVALSRTEPQPLWLFIVSKAASGKTELLNMLKGWEPHVEFHSQITPKALVSGARVPGGEEPSLLGRLHHKILVFKDYTQQMDAIKETDRKEVEAALRGAYDGGHRQVFGNGKVIEFDCQFPVLAAVTPVWQAAEYRSAVFGARFLAYSMVPLNDHEETTLAFAKPLTPSQKEEMSLAFGSFLDERHGAHKSLPLPTRYRERLQAAAKLVAKARSDLLRSRRHGQAIHQPSTEASARLIRQGSQLASVLALVSDRAEITDEDMNIVIRVIVSCGMGIGQDIILSILEKDVGWFKKREVREPNPTIWTQPVLAEVFDVALPVHLIERAPFDSSFFASTPLAKKLFNLAKIDMEWYWNVRDITMPKPGDRAKPGSVRKKVVPKNKKGSRLRRRVSQSYPLPGQTRNGGNLFG